jgi:flagellar biosynthesis/type III secretory pathway M-ring protein FliF/YscJ
MLTKIKSYWQQSWLGEKMILGILAVQFVLIVVIFVLLSRHP